MAHAFINGLLLFIMAFDKKHFNKRTLVTSYILLQMASLDNLSWHPFELQFDIKWHRYLIFDIISV